jgi:hypothetical protein
MSNVSGASNCVVTVACHRKKPLRPRATRSRWSKSTWSSSRSSASRRWPTLQERKVLASSRLKAELPGAIREGRGWPMLRLGPAGTADSANDDAA